MQKGKVVRSAVSEVPSRGRLTTGVIFAKPDKGDSIIAVARNVERNLGEDDLEEAEDADAAAAEVQSHSGDSASGKAALLEANVNENETPDSIPAPQAD